MSTLFRWVDRHVNTFQVSWQTCQHFSGELTDMSTLFRWVDRHVNTFQASWQTCQQQHWMDSPGRGARWCYTTDKQSGGKLEGCSFSPVSCSQSMQFTCICVYCLFAVTASSVILFIRIALIQEHWLTVHRTPFYLLTILKEAALLIFFSVHSNTPGDSLFWRVDLMCAAFSGVHVIIWFTMPGIFKMQMAVTACDCTRGLCKHWKPTLGETSLAAAAHGTCISSMPDWRLPQLQQSCIPINVCLTTHHSTRTKAVQ